MKAASALLLGIGIGLGLAAGSAFLDLLPEARPGDYVLVHAGFAIQRLDPGEAAEVLALFEEAAGGEVEQR